MSLQINVQKSRNIAFRRSNKQVSTRFTMKNQPLRQLVETTYLWCGNDVERTELAFFKQFKSIYQQFSFKIKMCCCMCFDYTQRRFIELKPDI